MLVPTPLPQEMELVPTVFITNRTLVQIPNDEIPDLANKMVEKLQGQLKDLPQQVVQEIQIDCDWTQSTKVKYFTLLALLNTSFKSKRIKLSATIRLHQIKYAAKTGIPPVARGMLMYYNMGDVQDSATQNSILDNAIGQKYLQQLADYPLPLDVALPLFQWGVLFRNGKMIKLFNQLMETALSDDQRFTKVDHNHWEVIKSTYLNGVYLYTGDKIRLEKVSFKALERASELLQQQLKKDNRSIVFYHLDEAVVQQFEQQRLQSIVNNFKL